MTGKRFLALAPLQIAQALIGFGAIAAFTRLMSPEEFGRYALALSASMAAHTLLFTWAEAAAFRFFAAARAERRLRDHYATLLALVVCLGAAVLAATAALLFIVGLERDIAALSAFAAAAAVFRFLTRITRESDRAALEIGRFATLETVYIAIGFAAGIGFLVVADLGAAAPFAGLLLAGVIVALIDAPRLLARTRGGLVSPQRAFVYASYGAPLALALAVDLCVQTAARFLLAEQGGAAELGAYAAAFGLARPLDLVFMGAGAALSPLILTAFETRGPEAARAQAKQAFTLLIALAAPAAAGLALVATPLAALMIGEGLRTQAAAALPWLAAAGLISGFNVYYLSEAFQLTRRTGLRALVMLAPGAVQLTLTAWLAGAHGAAGAAIAAAAGAGVGAVLLTLVGRRLFALPLALGAIVRVGAATALMVCAVLMAPRGEGAAYFATDIAIGAAAYATGALIFNILDLRTRVSALLQRLLAKVRAHLHSFFTDRAHVRLPW
ncbi:MAG: polysaccharide biosynthesis C-terminal domain-containing protein [Hyphomonadaceae bacterium]|nr:polysaccharide biosynthesis C-terminal domain-containing protein [Hyphomonadaceae bacterium]